MAEQWDAPGWESEAMIMSGAIVDPLQMPNTITVGGSEADIQGYHSRALQMAVDAARARGGGVVRIDKGVFDISAPLRLYDHVALVGAGEGTILRKSDGYRSKIVVDADYGELKVVAARSHGFEAGMGMQIYDANSTDWLISTAVITAVEDQVIHFDKHLVQDYSSDQNGVLSSACSVIEGIQVEGAEIRNLAIDGNGGNNDRMNGCRGGGIYFYKAKNCLVEDVKIANFNGDGVSLQIVEDMTVKNCEIKGCLNYGLHPGTGALRAVVEGCDVHDNGSDGMYVCWRVRRGWFVNNRIYRNGGNGVNIGHKDEGNVFADNHVFENGDCGIHVRAEKESNGSHRNKYLRNLIENNGNNDHGFGILIRGITTGTVIEDNIIRDTGAGRQKVGIFLDEGVSDTQLRGNRLSGHSEGDLSTL
ncbi:MAG: right-handed parallel beta-helix repeat-containing protein [Bacilli bacterium]